MNVHFAVADILQDAIVRGWFASRIMVLGQSIDGYSNPAPVQAHPLCGNGNDSAGHYQGENVLLTERRQNAAEFPVSNHWLTTD